MLYEVITKREEKPENYAGQADKVRNNLVVDVNEDDHHQGGGKDKITTGRKGRAEHMEERSRE